MASLYKIALDPGILTIAKKTDKPTYQNFEFIGRYKVSRGEN